MKLSIVVIFHDMRREAARTLRSLSLDHQRDLASDDYEVIAIDNGSHSPLEAHAVTAGRPNFRYHFHRTGSVSPVQAVNLGADMATGELIAVIVDGARMASPGLVGETQRAARLYPDPFIYTLSWHLGPEVQNISMTQGYDQAEEDRLIEAAGWPADGYALFSISTLAQSSRPGLLHPEVPAECSWFAMRRDRFIELGGFDPRFETPGGGLVNHDFRNRAVSVPGIRPIGLLGEGVFHQYHGGVATNVLMEDHPFRAFDHEYRAIRGEPYAKTASPPPAFFGALPAAARRFLA